MINHLLPGRICGKLHNYTTTLLLYLYYIYLYHWTSMHQTKQNQTKNKKPKRILLFLLPKKTRRFVLFFFGLPQAQADMHTQQTLFGLIADGPRRRSSSIDVAYPTGKGVGSRINATPSTKSEKSDTPTYRQHLITFFALEVRSTISPAIYAKQKLQIANTKKEPDTTRHLAPR